MEEFNELDLRVILRKILNRWKLIVIFTTLLVLLAYGNSAYLTKDVYESNIKVLVLEQEENLKVEGSEVIGYVNLMTTFRGIALTNPVFDLAADNYTKISSDEYKSNTIITFEENAMIININFKNENPNYSYAGVEAYYSAFKEISEKYIKSWEIVKIEEAKVPEMPIPKNTTQEMVTAFVVGILMSVTISLLLEYFNFGKKEKKE